MIAQQHKIMRQVLEVRGCSRDAAQHVQSELRDAYRERLLPLIEAICSELSAPGRIDRVDRLEIDLGELPLETFEAALADSFAPAFRSRLGAAARETIDQQQLTWVGNARKVVALAEQSILPKPSTDQDSSKNK